MNPAVIDGVAIGAVIAGFSSLAHGLRGSSRRQIRQSILTETFRALYASNVEASEVRAQIAKIRAARRSDS